MVKELFRLDSLNSTPYVLLTNIYAYLGRWDEASTIRDQMNVKQIAKGLGYNWINVKYVMLILIGYNPNIRKEGIEEF